MKVRVVFRSILFVIILGVAFSLCSIFFRFPSSDVDASKYVPGFYDEPENTLDAVYIGASNVFGAWAPPIAWEHYGIAVYPFGGGGMKVAAAEYMIEEARKRQPDALYIVGICDWTLDPTPDPGWMHRTVDYIPMSLNKIRLVEAICDMGDLPWKERLEYYIPLIRYHSRWNDLTEESFLMDFGNNKAGDTHLGILSKTTDLTASYRKTELRGEIPADQKEYLEKLLRYCEEENVNTLFVITTGVVSNLSSVARLNSIKDLCEEHGFPVLDLLNNEKEIGLDLSRDFYNAGHVNIHGMLKATDYVSRYLIEHYGFEDKRGDPAYSEWDQAYDDYVEIISPYSLDFEYENGGRDYSLKPPELTKLAVNGTTLTLSWKAAVGADGYCIYRKCAGTGWAPVATVDGKTLSYADKGEIGKTYTYTVVPFRNSPTGTLWGDYDVAGLSAMSVIDAPTNVSIEGETNDLTICWDPVPGADGYVVARRVVRQNFIALDMNVQATSYTDTAMLEDTPYQYWVRAFQNDENGEAILGTVSKTFTYLPELSGPAVTAELADGIPTLTWSDLGWSGNYTVTRRTDGGDWEQIAEPLAAGSVQFRDVMADAGTEYEYQVTASIAFDGNTYSYPSEPARITAEAEAVELEPPEILMAEQIGNIVQLVWEPSDNATSYRVYRQAEGESGQTVLNNSVSGNTYQDKPPAEGEYTYIVQPLYVKNGCTYYGEFREDAGRLVAYGAG